MTYQHKMQPLDQAYDTQLIEKKWQDYWHKQKTYRWDATRPRADNYVLDTPPPTVSGHLHMGHVFSYTQADFIARYQRMQGKNVFYPMGFDDNGLPTERLVEKTKKIRAKDVGREAFIETCESVAEMARKDFRTLFESIALSVDWEQEYHTISAKSRALSQISFLDLVEKDHVYRKLQPMLWDPIDQTAIAQAEVIDKELPSHFSDVTFQVAGSDESFVIGTTRPELIPACVAIFYHPDDARYKHLASKEALTPLFGVRVPILADESVEIEKGTGIMMCCTFGDEKDIEKWKKHDLPTRVILNKYGKIDLSLALESGQFADGFSWPETMQSLLQNKKVSNADKKHPGARQLILQALADSGDLVESKPITHAVKCAERSGAPLEILPSHQWFIRVTDKKELLKEKAQQINWYPEFMRTRVEQWIDGLSWDWCISRQRYFGVPFPVWYSKREGEEGKMLFASAEQLPINPLTDLPAGYSRDEVEGDSDVMDTWATSSISPQLSAGAITVETAENTDRFNKLFPADLRPQAHEIIRSWAFYTIVKAHLHNGVIPWKNIMISGWCLAEDKSKMSKSKGNTVTPVALIEQRGTDAVRYWAATSRLGQDTAFSPDLLKIGKKLVSKLFNATKFAAIHLSKLETAPPARAADDSAIVETLDQWIISRLHETITKASAAYDRYEYAEALDATNQFFWTDFCDNYLELIKARVYNEQGNFSGDQQLSAVHTLYHLLLGFLKLYAPITPHVTEELYAKIYADNFAQNGSLHSNGQWPDAGNYPHHTTALAYGKMSCDILEAVRKAKSENQVSIKYPVASTAIICAENLLGNNDAITSISADLKGAGNIASLRFSTGEFAVESVILADRTDAA
jgi:valyl-tRNA synthetase